MTQHVTYELENAEVTTTPAQITKFLRNHDHLSVDKSGPHAGYIFRNEFNPSPARRLTFSISGVVCVAQHWTF